MGRPLNKRFFQGGTGATGFQVGCDAWFTGEGSAESSYIISQRSNTSYLVGSDAGGATPTRTEVLTLVQGEPLAGGEMQVEVTPELLAAASEATFTFDSNGTVDVITITDGGSGYFTGGTFNITTASGEAGDDLAVITYTVANQAIVTAAVTTPGSTYNNQTGASVNTADIPDAEAAGDEQSAKIINARTVKTFEGNTYQWPAVGGTGTPSPSGRIEADLQEAT